MLFIKNILVISNIVLKQAKRKKDFYVLFILALLLILILSFIRFYELETSVRYVKEIALLLIWIYSIFASILFAGKQIPKEIENKTIFPLLAKPISKLEFIIGKFLGVLSALFISLLCFYLVFFILAETSKEAFFIVTFLQGFFCHIFLCAVLIAMTMAGSVFITQSANITICFLIVPAILIFGQHLKTIAISMPKISQNIMLVLYYCIPHFEFFDLRTLIIHSWQPIKMFYVFIFASYGFIWVVLFLMLTYLKFKLRD